MSTAAATTTSKPVLWSPGDWNAFFGFMHGPAVGIGVTPRVALAYALVAAGFFAYARSGAPALPKTAAVPAE